MTTRFERCQALLLAMVLAIGFGAAWGLAVVLAALTVMGIFPVQVTKQPGFQESQFVLRDGTPVIQSAEKDEKGKNIFRTIDGKPIDVKKKPMAFWDRFLYEASPSRSIRTKLLWRQRIQALGGGWYFVHDGNPHGRGYFVGYDLQTNLRTECIGRNGFTPNVPPSEDQFAIDGWKLRTGLPAFKHGRSAYLATNDGLLKIDFCERTVKRLLSGSDVLVVTVGAKDPNVPRDDESDEASRPWAIVLRRPDGVSVLTPDGKLLHEYILPQELREAALQIARLPNGQAIAQEYPEGRELFWIDGSGKVLRRERVALRREPAEHHTPWPFGTAKTLMGTFSLPSPATILGVLACDPWDIWNTPWRPRTLAYAPALRQAICDVRWILAINGAISAVLAVVCYRRQRKYGLPWTWAWTVFVLLFGLPGFCGYLFHRQWPARLPCPNCGRPAPRDRPACLNCGRDFPAPAPKGIEVFA